MTPTPPILSHNSIPIEFYLSIPLNFLTILKLTPAEALVLAQIRYIEKQKSKTHGQTCISRYDTIGEYLGMTERAVSYAAKKLQDKGLLHVAEYHSPNARRSYLKTWYKKTLQPVDDALFFNGLQSIYVKIPNQIVKSTLLNASNKVYYALISNIRSKYDIDGDSPVSYKEISSYLPDAKRKTVSDNIKKLQEHNIIDELGYSIYNDTTIAQAHANAHRGKTKIATLSLEEKYLLNNVDSDSYDAYLNAILKSKAYYRSSVKRHKNKDKYILDLPFVFEEEEIIEEISRVGELYTQSMQGIYNKCNLQPINFEQNKAIFEKESWDKIRKIDIEKQFISAHTSAINFACDHGYINQFPEEYFKDVYQYFPKVLENVTANKKIIEDTLIRIGVITPPTLSWDEEIEREFNTSFFQNILTDILNKFKQEKSNSLPVTSYELSIMDIMSSNYIDLDNPSTFEKVAIKKLHIIIDRFKLSNRINEIPKEYLSHHCGNMNEFTSQNCAGAVYE